MEDRGVSTIYRSVGEIDLAAASGFQWSDENWKRASLLGKVWLGVMLVATAVTVSAEKKEGHSSVDGFTLLSSDGSKTVFTYGHQKYAPDSEVEAFQKAVNEAMRRGFKADAKSISMFANRKIDRLILTIRGNHL